MEQRKTDERVKTGLQIEGHSKPHMDQPEAITGDADTSEETDADELVHEQNSSMNPDDDEEQDIDELVHEAPASKTVTDHDEVDPDDLVHEK